MAPRSSSDRSPITVMRFSDESSTSSSVEMKGCLSKGLPTLSKSVKFGENVIFDIPHIDDIPEHEVFATWYGQQEYSAIKSSYQCTIFMMEAGEHAESEEHTSRGLEYRTQEGAWARYENKRDAYNSVLDEQDRQWKVDKDDFEKIRQIYLRHSTKCANAAVVRALQDAKEAREHMLALMESPLNVTSLRLQTGKQFGYEKGDKIPATVARRPSRNTLPDDMVSGKGDSVSTSTSSSSKTSKSKSPRDKSPDKRKSKSSSGSSSTDRVSKVERKKGSSSSSNEKKKSSLSSSSPKEKKDKKKLSSLTVPASPRSSTSSSRPKSVSPTRQRIVTSSRSKSVDPPARRTSLAVVGGANSPQTQRRRSSLMFNDTRGDISMFIERSKNSTTTTATSY